MPSCDGSNCGACNCNCSTVERVVVNNTKVKELEAKLAALKVDIDAGRMLWELRAENTSGMSPDERTQNTGVKWIRMFKTDTDAQAYAVRDSKKEFIDWKKTTYGWRSKNYEYTIHDISLIPVGE